MRLTARPGTSAFRTNQLHFERVDLLNLPSCNSLKICYNIITEEKKGSAYNGFSGKRNPQDDEKARSQP